MKYKPSQVLSEICESHNQTVTQKHIDQYNHLMLNRKIAAEAKAIQTEFNVKASKISRYVQKNVRFYPDDTTSQQIFLDSIIDIEGFQLEKDLLHAILTSKDPKNNQVHTVLNLLENMKNPHIDYEPITLDSIEYAKADTITSSNHARKSLEKLQKKSLLVKFLNKITWQELIVGLGLLLFFIANIEVEDNYYQGSRNEYSDFSKSRMPIVIRESNVFPPISEMTKWSDFNLNSDTHTILDPVRRTIVLASLSEYLKSLPNPNNVIRLPKLTYKTINEPLIQVSESFLDAYLKKKSYREIQETSFIVTGYIHNNEFNIATIDLEK